MPTLQFPIPQVNIVNAVKMLHKDEKYEVRQIVKNSERPILSGIFEHPDELYNAIVDSEVIEGSYITLNPFLSIPRKANVGIIGPSASDGCIRDRDIVKRRWILIDIDPIRPAKTSSSEEEKGFALEVACRIADYFDNNEVDYTYGDSGNGYHLLLKVNADNTTANDKLINNFLAYLNSVFSTDKAKVDTSVYNASRITKLYGTWARKGENSAERPWRRSTILIKDVKETELKKLKDLAPSESLLAKSKDTTNVLSSILEHFPKVEKIDCEEFEKYVLNGCPFNPEHKGTSSVILAYKSNGYIHFDCKHDSCQGKKLKDVLVKLGIEGHEFLKSNDIKKVENDAEALIKEIVLIGGESTIYIEKSTGIRHTKESLVALYGEAGKLFTSTKFSAKRESYRGLCFDPSNEQPPYIYNTYDPSVVMKATGVCTQCPPMIYELIENVLGSEWFAKWFIKHEAWKLQNIGKTKGCVSTVILGTQGTGKTTLSDIFKAIYGRYHKSVSNESLTDTFNGFLFEAISVWANEITRNETKKARSDVAAKLKMYVCGDDVGIRRMYQEATTTPNFSHWNFTSNATIPLDIENNDRRFVVVRSKKGNLNLNPNLKRIISDAYNLDVIQEFVNYLYSLDVSDHDPRFVVNTEEKEELLLATEGPIAGWWRRMCPAGVYTGDQLYDSFKHYCNSEGIVHVPEKRIFLAGRHHNSHIIKSNVSTKVGTLTIPLRVSGPLPTTVKAYYIQACDQNADNKLETEISIADLLN